MKKFLAIALSLTMLATSQTSIFASNTDVDTTYTPKSFYVPNAKSGKSAGIYSTQDGMVITNTNEIKKYVELNNIDIPYGEELVKIEIIRTEDDPQSDQTDLMRSQRGAITIKNVKTSSGDYTIASHEEVDKISNYSTTQTDKFSTSYTQTKSNSWDVGTKASGKIGVAAVEASVGFKCTGTKSNTKTFETSILPRKRVEVKVNTNYTMKTYDVYNGSALLDTGSAWTPKGLLIVKYEYKI
jgi:hypothetical protein